VTEGLGVLLASPGDAEEEGRHLGGSGVVGLRERGLARVDVSMMGAICRLMVW
jgi:hypothetical protein